MIKILYWSAGEVVEILMKDPWNNQSFLREEAIRRHSTLITYRCSVLARLQIINFRGMLYYPGWQNKLVNSRTIGGLSAFWIAMSIDTEPCTKIKCQFSDEVLISCKRLTNLLHHRRSPTMLVHRHEPLCPTSIFYRVRPAIDYFLIGSHFKDKFTPGCCHLELYKQSKWNYLRM